MNNTAFLRVVEYDLLMYYEQISCLLLTNTVIFRIAGCMEAVEQLKIDWLSLSPRVMARVMELSEQLGTTPVKTFELMVTEAANMGADVRKASPVGKREMVETVA